MIKNKRMFYLSLTFLFISMVLNVPFPHKYPYGEAIMTILNIPIQFANGFHTVGIITLFLLLTSLISLVISLDKYHGRMVIIAILIFSFFPVFAVNSYQKTFAQGIYAVSYSNEESRCSFVRTNEKTLHGECTLSFQNYSNNDIQFYLEFYEEAIFKDDLPFISLMNNSAPYQVTLEAKESKQVHIKTDIDLSDIKNHIEGGEATGVNIIIRENEKDRKL